MRRFWDEFVHIVGVEAVHELDREKIHRQRRDHQNPSPPFDKNQQVDLAA